MIKVVLIAIFFGYSILLQANTHSAPQDGGQYWCTKSSNSNLRNGPSKDFVTTFNIPQAGYILSAKNEIDGWLQVTDYLGHEGWIKKYLVKPKCGVMTLGKKGYVTVFYIVGKKKFPITKLKNGSILKLKKCTQQYCKVRLNKIQGVVLKSELWGL